jgi:hypothetical protein
MQPDCHPLRQITKSSKEKNTTVSNAFRDTLATTSSSGHWYDRHGDRIETVFGAKGQPVKPTVVQARKLDLAPGVTTILKSANREALNTYREHQILAAAKTHPQRPNEPDSDWFARVLDASREHAATAADLGTEIHARIERGLGDPTCDDPVVLAVAKALDGIVPGGRFGWQSEAKAVSPYGYATRADLWHPEARVLVDIKTKTGPLADQSIWPDHPAQLAATVHALLPDQLTSGEPMPRCAILFARRDAVEARLVEVAQKDLETGWTCFAHLLAYWQTRYRARPSWAKPVLEALWIARRDAEFS